MQIKTYLCNAQINENYGYPIDELLFFDIETTGFMGKHQTVYLIGVCYQNAEGFMTKQWFAENKTEEEQILIEFFEFCKHFKILVSYNGDGFDIPFLKDRANHYGISYQSLPTISLDIYREIKSLKGLFKTENLKQKTMEQFLQLERTDMYSGKDLIQVYEQYQKEPDEQKAHLLLLHNRDDVEGLLSLFPLLSYKYWAYGNFNIESASFEEYKNHSGETLTECVLLLKPTYPIPIRVSAGKNGFYLTGVAEHAKLRIPVYKGELKYFFSNYKDYYYLPVEDTSIHKSVAFYVDKDFRVQAKASNCYSRKNGVFLPQITEEFSPYFKKDYKDSITYFECTQEILDNPLVLSVYVKNMIQFICK